MDKKNTGELRTDPGLISHLSPEQAHIQELSNFLWQECLKQPDLTKCCMCDNELDAKKERWGSTYCRSCYEGGC